MPPVLPEFRLSLEPLSAEAEAARGYEWADEYVGHRSRIGGAPDWVRAAEAPRCSDCSEPMTFYAQLDGVGDSFDLADCGLIYVFVCFNDFATTSILQAG